MMALILAAGRGLRLDNIAGNIPKCLLKVGTVSLIERQILSLRDANVDRIAVVVGYKSDVVRQACGSGVEFVENEYYDRTNSLYSLWLARELLLGGCVIMNSDVLFHPQLLKDLITAQCEDALLVSYCNEAEAQLGEEEMKVKVSSGRVVDIAKDIDPREADGENVGIAKFGSEGAKLLVDQMNAIISAGETHHWAPRAFQEFAIRRPLHAIGTRGYPWTEIDFPEDYRRATEQILPRMLALDSQA